MTETLPVSAGPIKPIRNMRIRFWGVQGSCPLFPETHEVQEYKRLVTMDLLEKVLRDMAVKSHNGSGCKVEDLLGGPLTAATLDAYQRRLGSSTLPVYGGDTTCVGVETADGNTIVFDGGSGIRNCSKNVIQRWDASRPRDLYLFGTHEHLDHRSGLPFSQFCYVRPPFNLHLFGSFQFLNALDERYGVFSRQLRSTTHLDDPIDYRVMSASFRGNEIRNPDVADFRPSDGPPPWNVRDVNDPIRIGGTTVTAFDVYHGATRCLAYKVEHGDATFVFCTDHELRHGPTATDPRQLQSKEADDRLVEHCRGADVAYFDGQYFLDEYTGRKGIGNTLAVSRVDWGHGCIEDVVDRVRACGIRRDVHRPPRPRTHLARQATGRPLAPATVRRPAVPHRTGQIGRRSGSVIPRTRTTDEREPRANAGEDEGPRLFLTYARRPTRSRSSAAFRRSPFPAPCRS